MSGPVFADVVAILDAEVGQLLTPQLAAKIAGKFFDLTLGAPIDFSEIPEVEVGRYRIRVERFCDTVAELEPLHKAHWHETEDYRHGLPFTPDYDYVMAEEACGRYLLITLRLDGELVGNYGLFFVRSHHTQTIVAHEDTVFIAPEHRKGRNFIRLSQYAEAVARSVGARELRLSTKLTNKVSDMLPRMGYRHVANQFTKLL